MKSLWVRVSDLILHFNFVFRDFVSFDPFQKRLIDGFSNELQKYEIIVQIVNKMAKNLKQFVRKKESS